MSQNSQETAEDIRETGGETPEKLQRNAEETADNGQRGQFTFYRSYFEAFKDLPAKSRLQLYEAVCDYALNGTDPKLSGASKTVFTLIKPTLDTSRRRSEIGRAGGRAPRQALPKPEANPKQTEAKPKQTRSKPEAGRKVDIDRDLDLDIDIDRDLDLDLLDRKKEEKEERPDKAGPPPSILPDEKPIDFLSLYKSAVRSGMTEAAKRYRKRAIELGQMTEDST